MKTTKQINAAFEKLEQAFAHGWQNYASDLYIMCANEEKSHRGCMADFKEHHVNPPSVADMARMLAVKRVAQYLTGEKMPTPKDYLHCQKSILQAAGMVEEFRDKINEAWKLEDVIGLCALDYTDYVKTK